MPATLSVASYYIVAQANYSCDAYGAGNYSECAIQEATTPGGGTSDNNGSNAGGSSDSPSAGQDISTDTQQPSRSSADTPGTIPITDAVGGLSWWVIIIIALLVSIIAAWLILLWKRRKRRDNQQQPPTDTIYPTGFSG